MLLNYFIKEETMSIRRINYTVTADSITPASLQRGGLQGEHNATELIFNIESSLAEKLEAAAKYIPIEDGAIEGELYYRFEGYTCMGMKNSTLPIRFEVPEGVIKEFTLNYSLENWLTREGGNITVYLIFSILSAHETMVDLYSYPARLKLDPKEDGKYTDGKNYESVAKLSIAAEDAAERAEEAAEISVEAKELTEEARFALENGAEFIFLGGDASGAAEIDLVVDGELSEHSSNPISNEAVAKKLKGYMNSEELNELINNIANNVFENAVNSAKLAAHPIGSYYWSSEATNPSELFGGTWEQVKDSFVLAAGDNYLVGETGGEAEHLLTKEELPNYNLPIRLLANDDGVGAWSMLQRGWSEGEPTDISDGGSLTVSSGGSDTPHNNMPPFIVAYCWKRTA